MPVGEKTITLDSGCNPLQPRVPLGVQERDVRWTRNDGGAVIKVTISNPETFFDVPGRRDGDDYVIHYNGAGRPPLRTWGYSPKCQGGSVVDKAEEPPQMTNGPG